MTYHMTKIFQGAPRVKLGELIEECDLRNSDNTYTLNDLKGISIEKKFIETKANMDGVSLTSYKIVKPKWISFVPVTSRNGNKISLAFNDTKNTFIVSSAYTVFAVKNEDVLDASYLFLMLQRSEFDRIARFNSWGSARETYMFSDLGRYEIPLPAIEVQREYVAAYRSLQQLAEQNEALAVSVSKIFEIIINQVISNRNGEWTELSYLANPKDKRNINLECKNIQGLTVYKSFIRTKANMENVSLTNYKIVDVDDIGYVPTTNRNGDKLACGLAKTKCIISSTYEVLEINKSIILPEYLFYWFSRKEMDRYARYNSWGSARETIIWDDLKRYKIFLPPIEVQRSIVALYNCGEEARAIAKEAREQLKILAPAMVQRAANTPVEV